MSNLVSSLISILIILTTRMKVTLFAYLCEYKYLHKEDKNQLEQMS